MMLKSTAASPASTVSTTDLKPLQQFTALPSLGGAAEPLNNLDKLKKHKPELKAITKSVYPRDSTRFWNQVYTAVEGGLKEQAGSP